MFLKILTEAVRPLSAALVFVALLLVSTYIVCLAGAFGLRILGVNITGLLFYNMSAMRILNFLAAAIGLLFSARGVYRLLYMKSVLRQRLLFFSKELSYLVYLSLMLGFVLPYLLIWVCMLWRVTKGYLSQGLVVL